MNKKPVELGLPKNTREKLEGTSAYSESGIGKGVGNTRRNEGIPNFIRSGAETVYSGANNTWIVLGRDRPGNLLSGYGGLGDTQAGAIDLVVGRASFMAKSISKDGEKLYVDPNFSFDAARIYVSQKTDIDENFELADGMVGKSNTRSGIGLKADNIRIMSREGIKLVTGVDRFNSQGGDINSVHGIDLIANNDDRDMQPIPKGDNVAEAIERQAEHLKGLTSVVETMLTTIMKLNLSLMGHVHVATAPGAPTLPSVELIAAGIIAQAQLLIQTLASLPLHRANIEMMKANYLQPFGSKYINSRYNHTN
jgi:hypothetical protein